MTDWLHAIASDGDLSGVLRALEHFRVPTQRIAITPEGKLDYADGTRSASRLSWQNACA